MAGFVSHAGPDDLPLNGTVPIGGNCTATLPSRAAFQVSGSANHAAWVNMLISQRGTQV